MQTRTYLAVASWAVLAVALAQQQAVKLKTHRPLRVTASERIDSLQLGFQAALNDLSMTNLRVMKGQDDKGRPITYKIAPSFGLRRTPSAMLLHDGVMRDSGVSAQLYAQEEEVQYFALSNLGKPLSANHLTLHKNVGPFAFRATLKEQEAIVGFAKKACSRLPIDTPVKGHILGVEAQARTLILSKAECLPCHQDSKVGDPLAILVFLTPTGPTP